MEAVIDNGSGSKKINLKNLARDTRQDPHAHQYADDNGVYLNVWNDSLRFYFDNVEYWLNKQ